LGNYKKSKTTPTTFLKIKIEDENCRAELMDGSDDHIYLALKLRVHALSKADALK
jgi:hypothetical protein